MAAAVPATAAPVVRKLRRSIDPVVWPAASLRDGDILAFLPMGVVWQKLRCPIQQGQSAPILTGRAMHTCPVRLSHSVEDARKHAYGSMRAKVLPDRAGMARKDDWERGRADWRGRDHRPLLPAAGHASGGLRAD